jgi:4-hydroxy-tetrahydrodipicolinate synthase
MAVFKGAGVAIVTPFTKNNEVDFEKLGELIDIRSQGYGCYHYLWNYW